MEPSPPNRFRIGAVSRAAGIPPATIRAWERRYEALAPSRSDAGGRLYSELDVQRLILLRIAVDLGHAIGTIASLPDAELSRLSKHVSADPAREARARFLDAVARFDQESADRELARAAALFPNDALVHDLLAPLLREVGERWAHREIGIAQEHLATSLVRGLLVSLTRLAPPPAGGPPVVFATLPGERHEMGLLLAAFLAATRRRRVLYLGVEVPAADLANTARRASAVAVALSLVSDPDPAATADELAILSSLAPASCAVWLGGRAASLHAGLASSHRWKIFPGVTELAAEFDAVASPPLQITSPPVDSSP
ncbi:MAG: MerR family transcriptional regulator [Planctomycetes bacterium]|nr:MerR family transcriptional regulator [Planctomycetota bacterium]